VAKLGHCREQGVADGHDGGRSDRLLQPLAALVAPACDERAVAELADGDGGKKEAGGRP